MCVSPCRHSESVRTRWQQWPADPPVSHCPTLLARPQPPGATAVSSAAGAGVGAAPCGSDVVPQPSRPRAAFAPPRLDGRLLLLRASVRSASAGAFPAGQRPQRASHPGVRLRQRHQTDRWRAAGRDGGVQRTQGVRALQAATLPRASGKQAGREARASVNGNQVGNGADPVHRPACGQPHERRWRAQGE